MSEVAKPTEATPPAPVAVEGTDSTPLPSATPATATSEPSPAADPITSASEATPVAAKEETVKDGEAKVEATPATEGTLGYKGPRLIQSLRFSKRFFWFSDEAFKTDTLDSYLRAEKADIAHSNAAWAHETGKGLLFFAKRAEDRAAPSGIVNLAEISDVTKEGSNDFSFHLNGHKHVFQATSTAERASWVVAIESQATEAKGMKEGLVASEGYKKHLERYNKLGVGAATTGTSSHSKSKERKETSAPPKKSLDARAKEAVRKDKADSNSASSSDVEKKDKKDKSRSQSRKRSSIFGILGNKKEDHAEKKDLKEEKAEEKAEKKHDNDVAKEEKKHESDLAKEHHKRDEGIAKEEEKHTKETAKEEHQHDKELAKEEKKLEKEDANATHQPSEATEAGAAVAAAAPVGAATAHPKEVDETRAEETKPESSNARSAETQEKKGVKRGSIFGSLFGGKKEVTSPSTEKPEGEAPPDVPTKDSAATPISETAPKIDEPIQNKPIDTAAVTAPMDSTATAHEPPAGGAHAQTTTAPATTKSPSTPSHKGGVMGFFKRQDSKAEPKKEVKAEEPITSPTDTQTSAASDSPVAPGSEGKPALKERRRTSIFNSLSNKKDKKPGESTSETEATEGETKKSPLPQKLGGLFRRPSKAVKSEETQTEPDHSNTETAPIAEASEGAAASSVKEEPVLTNGTSEAPKESAGQAPSATTNTAPEVKASA